MQQMCVGIIKGFIETHVRYVNRRDTPLQHWSDPHLQACCSRASSSEMNRSVEVRVQHLRGLVHFFVDLLDR